MTEATLILAALARRFRPRLAAGADVRLQSRITLRPADGLQMTLEKRKEARKAATKALGAVRWRGGW